MAKAAGRDRVVLSSAGDAFAALEAGAGARSRELLT
jgi:hypothetical protein